MFIEVKESFFRDCLIPYLEEFNVKYIISDCTLPNEKEKIIHVEFETELTKEQIEKINGIYQKNGKEKELVIKRERKWDRQYHTLKQELKGHITGQNLEEEVIYEHK